MVAGTIAIAVGAVIARRAGTGTPSLRAWRDATIIGAGFVGVSMGATSWASTRLPSSVTALLVATAPLWIVLLQLVETRGASRSMLALAGVVVGTIGVGALVAPGSGEQSMDLVAVGVLVVANGIWAAASLFARRATRPGNLVLGVGMQMLTGGLMLGIVAVAAGELGRFDPASISLLALGSWTWLVLASSLGGFIAYGWLLENSSASTASTHAFINPLVAVALGAVLLHEAIDQRMLFAGAAVITAVVLLMLGEQRVPAATAVSAGQPTRRRRRKARLESARAARPAALGRAQGRRLGWSPAPTPSFAARRGDRPHHATDGMDALSIDEALDGFG
jgi:drug/metabolite transporter (DMT)-like permease